MKGDLPQRAVDDSGFSRNDACHPVIPGSKFTKMKRTLEAIAIVAVSCLSLVSCATGPLTATNAANASAGQISRDSRAALRGLYQSNPKASSLGNRAQAVLVFPKITKAGFMVGGMAGNGAMFGSTGSIRGYYQTAGLSYGLQAGVQQYGYALFLMNNEALRKLDQSGGWEIGSSPSVVVVDKGMAGSLSTTTLDKDAYAVFFDQKGLMAGLGLQGSKITRIKPGQ